MRPISANIDARTTDVVRIKKYLSGYERSIRIYGGDFTADWLLTDIHASKWLTKTKKTIKIEKTGQYKYVHSFNWHRRLPDNSYLDSKENLLVLHFFQKAIFIFCESQVVMPNASHSSLSGFFNTLMPFIQWCFRKEFKLEPRKYLLNRLTHESFFSYVKEAVAGGSFSTYGTETIFRKRFYELSNYKITSKNIYRLNTEDRNKVISYLKDNNLYTVGPRDLKIVDRQKLFEIFYLPEQLSYLHKTTAFLRQFEPDYLNLNDKILLPLASEFEFPGHTTPLIDDVIKSNETMGGVLGTFKGLFSLKSFFPDHLPAIERFRFNVIDEYINTKAKQNNLTLWIPLPQCLFMINSAIDIVLNQGDHIVEAMIDTYDTLIENDLLNFSKNTNRTGNKKQTTARNKIISQILNKYQDKIPSKTLSYLVRDYDEIRKDPPLVYLLEVLIGACYLIIAAMKPIRVNELNSLKHDCLYFKEGDGFWLMQNIEKGGIRGILPEDARPIPKVAAKAITILQKLNDHAKKHVPSNKESQYLNYLIKYGSSWREASIVDDNTIRSRLASFCDYIELPLDQYGRRWYVNVHELRKSFLLNFFWTFKFSSLDSARWMAGHTNSDHLYNYITSNFEGEEMAEVESEYAYQQLRLFKEGNKFSDISNIEDLNNDVCRHFNVKSISEIKADELKEWLEMQIESGNYEIYVYGIDHAKSFSKAEIAIKII
tara:strand:- start:3607 stop:5742 length:2136 start_codon:yes stop_codon:yes gene_type:complete